VKRPAPGRPLYALFWRLYLILGAISTAVGAALLISPGTLFPRPGAEQNLLRTAGAVFLVFGVVRIVNAVVQVRRLRRS
jgi:uncharacterized membrane protein HdeD (DUF308 family)